MSDPYATIARPVDPYASFSRPVSGRQQSKPKRSMTQEVTGFMSNVNRGLGVGDELAAVGDMAFDFVQGRPVSFKASMADQRATEDDFAARRPNTAALARGTGMAATVAVPAGQTANALARAPTVVNAVRGATVAGLQGAGYAAADRGTARERLDAAAGAARDPVTLATGAVMGAAATPRVPMSKPRDIKVDQLQAQKTAAYAAADQAGVTYAPSFVDNLIAGIEQDLAMVRINPMRHPKAASMLDDIRGLKGQAPTLTELDQLRQVVRRDVASARDDGERFMGQRIIAEIDKHLDGAGPADVVAGSARNAADLIRNARDLNTRWRKVSEVQDAVKRAELRAGSTGSGGNADNAIRQNLRRVLEKGKNFTTEESAALEKIVMGGKGQNLLRLIGKLSPSGNGLMAAGNLASAATLGPLGAIPGAAGIIAKLRADGLTRKGVQRLIQTMANGGRAVRPIATGPARPSVNPAVAEKASRAVASQRSAAPRNAFARP